MPEYKVAIVYGFGEGEKQGGRFKRELARQGFAYTTNVDDADIIITHSGGCGASKKLPERCRCLVLIGPTYWPGKPLSDMGIQKVLTDLVAMLYPSRRDFYFAKFFWNLRYILTNPLRCYRIYREVRTYDLTESLPDIPILIVRNDKDAWLAPDLTDIERIRPDIKIVRKPHDHDDCWFEPESYVMEIKEFVSVTLDT